MQQQRPQEVLAADVHSSASGVKTFECCTKTRYDISASVESLFFRHLGHSHIFRPHIVKPVARPSSPSPFCTDAAPPAAPALPLPQPSGNNSQSLLGCRHPLPLILSFLFLLSSSSSVGVQGKWPTPGGDLTSVPLLSSPDLDALCDPASPAPTASLHRSSPPRSSSISSAALSSSPPPSHPPPHTQLTFPLSVCAQTSTGWPGREVCRPRIIVF